MDVHSVHSISVMQIQSNSGQLSITTAIHHKIAKNTLKWVYVHRTLEFKARSRIKEIGFDFCFPCIHNVAAFDKTILMSVSGKCCNSFTFVAKSLWSISVRSNLWKFSYINLYGKVQWNVFFTYTIIAQQILTRKSKRFSSAKTESQMRTTSGNGNSCDRISVSQRKL